MPELLFGSTPQRHPNMPEKGRKAFVFAHRYKPLQTGEALSGRHELARFGFLRLPLFFILI
jgi:hypothetical protein